MAVGRGDGRLIATAVVKS